MGFPNRIRYYRLRKHIGVGRWASYRERFVQPLGLETRKPLWYNTNPSYGERKLSQSWRWELPEGIAKATTPHQLLETWIYYRHKRKGAKHFMQCLHRLVQLGHVDR